MGRQAGPAADLLRGRGPIPTRGTPAGAPGSSAPTRTGPGSAPRVSPWAQDAARRYSRGQDLLERLRTSPWSFDFFGAVRQLECAFRHLPRVGLSQRVGDDPVRFCQEPSLAFSPCTVSEFRPAGHSPGIGMAGATNDQCSRPPRLFINFFGLLGPNGPMPLHLTEYTRDRERNHRDPTTSRFFDVFNHRMASFFYRAWALNSMPASYDRAVPEPGASERDVIGGSAGGRWEDDKYSVYVGSLLGLGVPQLARRDLMPDAAKMFYAGRLVPQARCAEGLVDVVSDYFGVRARVEEFAGRWLELPAQYQCKLGGSRSSASLGAGAVAGSRVWDRQSMVRLVLGPMSLSEFARFCPVDAVDAGPGPRPADKPQAAGRLRAWMKNYFNLELAWEARVVLKGSEVPGTKLGDGGRTGMGSRLGWTTWIGSNGIGAAPKAGAPDRGDLVLRG